MSLIAAQKDRARLSELKRCKFSLWHLALRLGYGWNPKAGKYGKGLTERVHMRVCDWLDARRERPFVFVEMGRWHHKTTLAICLKIQEILWNPNIAMLYWHAVDDEASRTLDEVKNLILKNSGLRMLDPIITLEDGTYQRAFPGSTKKFGTNSEFTINRSEYNRFDTLLAKGIQSVVTGAHGNIGFMDDIIERGTIEDNQLPKVASIFQNTIVPVVDDMRFRAFATPWSDWGLQADWLNDPDWCSLVIPGAVKKADWDAIDWKQDKIHLSPDYEFEYPTYGPEEMIPRQRERLRTLQRQMKADFGPQIMCDPAPQDTKPWKLEYEQFCRMDHAAGPGVVVVFSDPAPAGFGATEVVAKRDKHRQDKDSWALAVVKIIAKGEFQEFILLDGRSSKIWTKDEGHGQIAELCQKWGAHYVGEEVTGQAIALYREDLERTLAKRGLYRPLLDLAATYRGKNYYFESFCSAASMRAIWICESCPREYVDIALSQVRSWRRLGSDNGLQHDDEANAWIMCMDPAVQEFAPQPHRMQQVVLDYEDFEEYEYSGGSRSRYCGV